MGNFSGQNPEFSNQNVNPSGSDYAAAYGYQTNTLTYADVRRIIYDATPKEYPELKILMLNGMQSRPGDEFFYYEAQVFRKGVISRILTANIPAGTTQTFLVTNPFAASVDTLLCHPITEQTVNVDAVDTNTSTITIKAKQNEVLPALTSGQSYSFGNVGTITADGANTITQSQRLDELIRRSNYLQLFNRSTEFGVIEMGKYLKQGTTNYVEMNRSRLADEFKYDLANTYWMGQQGNVILSNGKPAKAMGGISPIMAAAGSFQTTITPANILEGVRQACLNTLYSKAGASKFLYIHPQWIDELQKQYKQPLIRFVPDVPGGDSAHTADFVLQGMKFGHTTVVLVPMQRFEPLSGSFPPSWFKKGFLLDNASIIPQFCEFFPEKWGQVRSRNNGNENTLNLYDIEYIQGSLSLEYNNPLGGAILNINA